MTLEKLRDQLYDPTYDVTRKSFKVINVVKKLYDMDKSDIVMEITHMMLLRLREACPHVYAVTIGQFPDFAGIHDYWREHGCVDPRGFTWLLPEPFGYYNYEWRYNLWYGGKD